MFDRILNTLLAFLEKALKKNLFKIDRKPVVTGSLFERIAGCTRAISLKRDSSAGAFMRILQGFLEYFLE